MGQEGWKGSWPREREREEEKGNMPEIRILFFFSENLK
jgi:hypothetical protein